MSKKYTIEEFISKAREVHGDRYDYSLFEYVSAHVKGKIICNKHGIFEQKSNDHLSCHGCPKCANLETGLSARTSIDDFISKAREVHGDKYDYSRFEYVTNKTKGKIICPSHGVFEQIPQAHLLGLGGCSDCNGLKKLNVDDFISKAREVHGDKYNYSRFEYVNCRTKGKIICPSHGVFEQIPQDHCSDHGCQKCANEMRRRFVEEFISKAREVHGDRYDYSLFEYVTTNTKGKIICNKHGVFDQAPHSHLAGQGCAVCAVEERMTRILGGHYGNVSSIIAHEESRDWS
jgi:hypothetical protein